MRVKSAFQHSNYLYISILQSLGSCSSRRQTTYKQETKHPDLDRLSVDRKEYFRHRHSDRLYLPNPDFSLTNSNRNSLAGTFSYAYSLPSSSLRLSVPCPPHSSPQNASSASPRHTRPKPFLSLPHGNTRTQQAICRCRLVRGRQSHRCIIHR
jgi:hypothetical protein